MNGLHPFELFKFYEFFQELSYLMTLGLAFLLKNLKSFSFFGDVFPPNSVQQTQTLVSTNMCVIHAILFLVSVLYFVLAWTSALN